MHLNLWNCLPLVCIVVLTGCATPISKERLATADYGPQPSENYQEIVKASFAQILIDPTAPIYEFAGTPQKGYVRQSPMLNLPEGFGWKVCGTINSKNRMGGYSGSVPFFVLMRGDNVTHRVLGEIPRPGSGGLSFLNNSIDAACMRTAQ